MTESWSPKIDGATNRDRNMMFVPGNKELRADPGVKRLYSIDKETRAEGLTAFEQQREIGQKFGGIFRGKQRIDEFRAGQENISKIVSVMEAINPGSLYQDNSDENRRRVAHRIRMVQEYFRGFYTYADGGKGQPHFHQGDYDLVLDSALAEFAVMQALNDRAKKNHWEVYRASGDEDLMNGTDSYLWDPRQKKALAIQTKCLTATRAPKHLAKGLSLDPNSINDRILDNDDYSGIGLLQNRHYRAKFERSAQSLLTNCTKHDNLIPVFVFLPKMHGEPVTFDRTTGLPKPRMKDELSSELGFML